MLLQIANAIHGGVYECNFQKLTWFSSLGHFLALLCWKPDSIWLVQIRMCSVELRWKETCRIGGFEAAALRRAEGFPQGGDGRNNGREAPKQWLVGLGWSMVIFRTVSKVEIGEEKLVADKGGPRISGWRIWSPSGTMKTVFQQGRGFPGAVWCLAGCWRGNKNRADLQKGQWHPGLRGVASTEAFLEGYENRGGEE